MEIIVSSAVPTSAKDQKCLEHCRESIHALKFYKELNTQELPCTLERRVHDCCNPSQVFKLERKSNISENRVVALML